MKALSFLLAMVNSVVSGLILLSCATTENLEWEALGRISGRVVTSSLVLVIGLLTFRDGVQPLSLEKMLISGMLLIILGVSSAAWGLHLSIISGDIKKVFLIYGGSLIVQGVASVAGLGESAVV